MSQRAAEIAILPLHPGTDLSTGDGKTIWNDTLTTISSQKGCNAIYWGHEIERPDTVDLVVDWETYGDHKTFMASPTYAPFVENIGKLLEGKVSMNHLAFPTSSPFSIPGSATVTECISLYFSPDHSTAAFDKNWATFVEKVEETAKEAKGLAGAWGIEEEVKHEKMERAILFGGFIGWPSVDAHMRFREQKEFKDIISYLRDGPQALEVHHVEFVKF